MHGGVRGRQEYSFRVIYMQDNIEENKKRRWKDANNYGWKAVTVVAVLAMAAMATWIMMSGSDTECDTQEPYDSGYLKGIRDVFDEAYTNGIAMIPFNETHSMALVPWEKQ